MTEAGREIAILSLGQILAAVEDAGVETKAAETIERHVRQVAAIVQGKPHNKPDAETETLLSQVRGILQESRVA